MNTAEYLVKKLEELGVNDFFGLPGDYNFEILYAIEENQNVNWHGCTNELNAGYAADGCPGYYQFPIRLHGVVNEPVFCW